MAITIPTPPLQDVANANAGSGTNTVTVTATATTSTLVAFCYGIGTSPTFAVPAGWTTPAVFYAGASYCLYVMWRSQGDGSTSYVFTPSNVTDSIVNFFEVGPNQNSAGNSVCQNGPQTSGTTWTGPAITNSIGGFLLAGFIDVSGSTSTLTAGTGWTLGHSTNVSTVGTLGTIYQASTVADLGWPISFTPTMASTGNHQYVGAAIGMLGSTINAPNPNNMRTKVVNQTGESPRAFTF